MNVEDLKKLDIHVDEDDYKLSITFNSLQQNFTDKNRVYVLHSDVKYSTEKFEWTSTLPAVEIPYKDPAMGFMLNGVVFSSVGIYQRAPGVVVSKDKSDSATGDECIDIVTSKNTTFHIVYRRNGIFIIFTKNKKQRSVPIGIFLKAISGLPYELIMKRFAFKSPDLRFSFPSAIVPSSQDLSKKGTFGLNSKEEPSIDQCINAVYSAITQHDNSDQYSTHWKLGRIKAYFSSLHFKSEQNYETVMSMHARALGTVLDQDINLPIFEQDENGNIVKSVFSISKGEFINESIQSIIRWYDIHSLRVKTSRSFTIQEDTPYLFRVKGYILKDSVRECGLEAGTLLDEEAIKKLNQSSVKLIEVTTPEGNKVVCRSGNTMDVGDFVTMLNLLMTCKYCNFNESSQYELANRVVIDYDKQVALEVEQTYSDIVNALAGCQELANLLKSLPYLPTRRLAEHLRDSDNKELVQAEITNVLSRAIAERRASALIKETPAAMTAIQPGQYGRVDALHSPESDKVGSVQELTAMARVNPETGEIEAPYERVIDGVPTGRIEYISASKEKNKYIVGWDEDFSSEQVMARYNGDLTTVDKHVVDYRDSSPYIDMSISRATVPFAEFSQPRRSLMASKMTGQAVPLLFPERPLISTGVDVEIPCLYYTARQIVEASLGSDSVSNEYTTLELISVSWNKNFAQYVCKYDNMSFVFSVPFTGTDKNTLYSFNLNFKEDYIYSLDDIVFYNQSCDMNTYEVEEYLKQGSLPLVTDVHKPSLALGVNLNVMFKTYQSSTVDDAVVISDRLISNRKLSSIQIFKYDYELRSGEKFSLAHRHAASHTYVYADQPVITVIRDTTSMKEKYIRAEQEGEVIVSRIDDENGYAEVWVATFHDAGIGDKVAGRHGNKSVIAKIVPEAEMPYDPETGVTADIICSPLGIPSRMNDGQLLEATYGAVCRATGKTAVVSPFYPNIKAIIQGKYDELGLKPKKLYLPKYGKFTERPVFIGNMYFLKLEQMSNLKWAAVGFPRSVDPVFGQPIDSATEFKGQAIGEMETWALAAAGAKNILNNLFTLYSSDAASRKRYMELLESMAFDTQDGEWDEQIGDAVHYTNGGKSALATQTVFRMFGQDLITTGGRTYKIVPLDLNNITRVVTVNDLRNHSESILENEWCKVRLDKPIINPFWVRNFPLKTVLGVPSVKALVDGTHSLDVYNKTVVPSNKIEAEDKVRYRKGIDAVIALIENTDIDELINKLSGEESNKVIGVESVSFDVDESYKEQDANNFADPDRPVDIYNADTDGYDPLDKQDITAAQLLYFLRSLKESGRDLKDLIWYYFPVMPKVFRQTTILNKQEREHSFQKQIVDICSKSSSQAIYKGLEQLIGYGQKHKDDLTSIRGYFFGKDSESGQHGKIRSSVLSMRVGMSGRAVISPWDEHEMPPYFIGIPWRIAMIEMCDILTTRLSSNATVMSKELATVFNSNGTLEQLSRRGWESIIKNLYEYNDYVFGRIFSGLTKSERIYLYNYLRGKVKDICESKVSRDGRVFVNNEWLDLETLPEDATIDAAVMLVGRQPTLHKRSIRAFFVRLVDGYCIRIHPMVCKGFNADFDGDTMYGVTLLGEMKNEAWKTISVLQDLVSEKDGSFTLSINQDSALGLYVATIFKDNAKEFKGELGNFYVYDNAESLRVDLEYGNLKYHDVVVFINKQTDCKYISTAGRVLVNAVVPGAMTSLPFEDKWGICEQTLGKAAISEFCNMQYDSTLVTTSTKADGYAPGVKVGDILLMTCKSFSSREAVNTAQALFEIGLVASDIVSVTSGLEDLSTDVDIQSYLEKPKVYVDKLNTLYQLGLISEREHKTSTKSAWSRVHSMASKAIISALPPTSNIHYLLYSGARGNIDQIMQSVGFIGTISKTVSEDISYPIRSGYGNGLTALELSQAGYSTRIGVVSTQAGTKNTGYSTRQTVYMSSGMCIVENDCGIENNLVDVIYDNSSTEVVWDDGRVTGIESLIGEFIDPTNSQYAPIMSQLYRTGYSITEDILSLLLTEGFSSLVLFEHTVKFRFKLDENWRKYVIEEGYSYALPFTENRKVTEKTVDWIEHHGLSKVIMFSESMSKENHCFDKEAYLPVDYDSNSFSFYIDGKKTTEELLYSLAVNPQSQGFHYYKKLLDVGNTLTMRALDYIRERQLRKVLLLDGRTLTISYEITKLFKDFVKGCYCVGLPYLDSDSTVTEDTLNCVAKYQLEAMPVHTDLTCLSNTGVCSKCHGKSLTSGKFSPLLTNLGIAAAQTQTETLSQSTLNVQHSGGNRSSGVGLVSGLGYYMRMLQGKLVSKKTEHLLEVFSKQSGYIKKNPFDDRFFQILDEQDTVLSTYTLDDPARCCVIDGSYIDAGTRIKTGWPNLDRFKGRDIFSAALKTRYMLMQEYNRIFSNLNVSPKTYALLVREQTSTCYLADKVNLPVTKDCVEEIHNTTGHYELRVSTQEEVVNKFSGVAGFAFENVPSMLTSGIFREDGLQLNSVLGNFVTGTTVGSQEAKFIPTRSGKSSANYRKSEVKKIKEKLKREEIETSHVWQHSLELGVSPENTMDAIESMEDNLMNQLLALGTGDVSKLRIEAGVPQTIQTSIPQFASSTEEVVTSEQSSEFGFEIIPDTPECDVIDDVNITEGSTLIVDIIGEDVEESNTVRGQDRKFIDDIGSLKL